MKKVISDSYQSEIDIIGLLTDKYNGFTRAERKVADFIYSNKMEPLYMSISNLSESCGVADATITRFCRSLGFLGFNEFKLSLAKSIAAASAVNKYSMYGETDPTDSLGDLMKKVYMDTMEGISKTLEGLNEAAVSKAVDMLISADNVFCMGQGGSAPIAMDAYSRFLSVSPKFHWVVDSHLQSMTTSLLSPKDLLLYFSYSGATKDIMDVFKVAKQSGARIVLLTRFEKSPASYLADQILLCLVNEGPLQAGSVVVKQAFLFIINVLFNEYCRRNEEESARKIEVSAKSIVCKHL